MSFKEMIGFEFTTSNNNVPTNSALLLLNEPIHYFNWIMGKTSVQTFSIGRFEVKKYV